MKKLGIGLILVVAVTLLVFSLLYMMPGNPIDIMTDRKKSARKWCTSTVSTSPCTSSISAG